MSRLPELMLIAEEHDLKIISIADLIAYRMKHESSITKQVSVNMPTTIGDFKLVAYTVNSTGQEHLALVKGEWTEDEPVLVRVHSSCVTGDIFGSCRCDCGPQLEFAMKTIEKEGKGVILYLFQEGRGIGLTNKLRAYKLQEEGYDTVEANIKLGFQGDQRDYGIGAQILHNLGVKKIRLLSNNPKKRSALTGFGLEIVENVAIEVGQNVHNTSYLKTKVSKMGHTLKLDD
jgi:3,4-dihydroxy 2-butanone 4-phosphate synthase/GTP cyclohydrolase II